MGTYGTLDIAHGYLLSGGAFTTIDFPGAGSTTNVFGINDASQIVGSYGPAGAQHGFLLSEAVFSTIDFPGANSTILWGINNAGQIVGNGFVFKDGTFEIIQFPGALSTSPMGINDAGQIVGSYIGSDFHVHGFLATPVPEPGSLGLLVLGVLALVACCPVVKASRAIRHPSPIFLRPTRGSFLHCPRQSLNARWIS